MTLLEKTITFSRAAYAGSTTVVCMIMFMPLGIAIREELALWNLKRQPVDSPVEVSIDKPPNSVSEIQELDSFPPNSSSGQEKKAQTTASCSTTTSCCGDICNKPERGEDTILQALLSMDMINLFIATFCGLGSSLTAIDNLGQIWDIPQRQ